MYFIFYPDSSQHQCNSVEVRQQQSFYSRPISNMFNNCWNSLLMMFVHKAPHILHIPFHVSYMFLQLKCIKIYCLTNFM